MWGIYNKISRAYRACAEIEIYVKARDNEQWTSSIEIDNFEIPELQISINRKLAAIPVPPDHPDLWGAIEIRELLADDFFPAPIFDDYEWIRLDLPIRVLIPNYIVINNAEIEALVNYCIATNVDYYLSKKYSSVYLSYLLPAHETILRKYPEIQIDTQ